MRALGWRKASVILIVGTLSLVLAGSPVSAADDKLIEELKASLEATRGRLDKLEKQNEELRRRLEAPPPPAPPAPAALVPVGASEANREAREKERINRVVDTYLKDREAQKKAELEKEAARLADEGTRVGSDTTLRPRWNLDQGLIFETKNRDFWSHIGMFVQWDTTSWTQSPQLKPANQIGDLQDGTFFRRIRPLWDGQAWGFVEWNFILALEQIGAVSPVNRQALINLDEVWAGMYGVPLLGRIRAGHLKICQGLEGNQFSSSRAMTFLENAAYTEAFYTIFGTGIQVLNSALDDGNGDRVTWQAMAYRDDFSRAGGNTGADFGDGAFCYTARATGLVFAECQDRHLLHLGLSGTWRKAEEADAALGLAGPRQVRLRARPEQRDAIGGFGDGAGFPGDTGRLVDTGVLTANSTTVLGTELFYIAGPFSVMAEWAYAQVQDVDVTVGGRRFVGDRSFHGGYVTVSYFLTGETRTYDRNFGREATFYVQRPFTNAFAKSADDGSWLLGWGAWEVAARYSYLNLNDGPIQGGVFSGLTLGLNWYLSSNLKVQFQYIHDQRYHKQTAPGGTLAGSVDGFGTRMQLQY